MEPMTRVSATVEAQEWAFPGTGATEYEGVRLVTDDPEKVIRFVDQLLFFLRVTRRKARPVTIRESKGVMEIHWYGRTPKPFRPGTHSFLYLGWSMRGHVHFRVGCSGSPARRTAPLYLCLQCERLM